MFADIFLVNKKMGGDIVRMVLLIQRMSTCFDKINRLGWAGGWLEHLGE